MLAEGFTITVSLRLSVWLVSRQVRSICLADLTAPHFENEPLTASIRSPLYTVLLSLFDCRFQ
ncbi:hypothetical protein BZM26_34115 [Paraburkholderia strydomiana]|nr:hypothetical protein BZM26_34115 [Paraburkholderia strydomiana]